jgi:hypothetical protein
MTTSHQRSILRITKSVEDLFFTKIYSFLSIYLNYLVTQSLQLLYLLDVYKKCPIYFASILCNPGTLEGVVGSTVLFRIQPLISTSPTPFQVALL